LEKISRAAGAHRKLVTCHLSLVTLSVLVTFSLFPTSSPAGELEILSPTSAVLHLTLFDLPDPARTDPATRAELAVQRAFLADAPARLAERWRARGETPPDDLRIRLHRFSGIQVEGVESTLLAIAGNVAPDILQVNFRQSETYIRQGFLTPLDDPADGWFTALPDADRALALPDAIAPVARRAGPDGATRLWMLPGGPLLGRVVLYRRDLFEAANLPPPSPDWTWDDFLAACRAIANPADGVYALGLSRGKHESYLWMPFLWGAGGEILARPDPAGPWRAVFDTDAGARALDYYIRLTSEPWRDAAGRLQRGYAVKDSALVRLKWQRGQLGMIFSYLDDALFASLNPDLTGMAPLPVGPAGRGTEINCRMLGIFAGVKDPHVRDAAWEYIRFQTSPAADALRVRALVESGYGRFVSAERLAAAGVTHLAGTVPDEWFECQRIALRDGRPEPYGQNANALYDLLTPPIRRAEELYRTGALSDDPPRRLAQLRDLLSEARHKAETDLLGQVPPDQMRRRRAAAAALLALVVAAAAFALHLMSRWFRPASAAPASAAKRRPFRRILIPLLLIAPAALTILVWAYIPLLRGSAMAFYDYHLYGPSAWVGLDNFANLLWDADWWRALLASARYAALVIGLTFLPPVGLAILLQEVPRGKILFRVIYYLPAAISGLVVILLWKSFYAPDPTGLANRIVLAIPAWGWILLALIPLLLGAHIARRLLRHARRTYALLTLLYALLLSAGALSPLRDILPSVPDGASALTVLAAHLPEPIRWLDDSRTALFSCVLPLLWAGMGPGCLIYLAALKGIPEELYEAADIDGATFTDKILFIVIPTLRPLLVINFVGVFIAAWQAEANILAMTAGAAGTEVAGLRIFYQAFLFLRPGPATAAAWMLATLLIGFTLLQLRMLSRVEFRANRSGD
jgi:multiple sugar transport system permease protein